MTYYIKIRTGYQEHQYHTIEADESEKAYFLFLHPDNRGIFKNGLAIRGQDIQAIEPDYHATMGWNKGYALTPDDYQELSSKGVDRKIRDLLYTAKQNVELDNNRKFLA